MIYVRSLLAWLADMIDGPVTYTTLDDGIDDATLEELGYP